MTARLAAQKFLSCVYRIRERSGRAVGLKHLAEVLTGASTEKVRRLKHDELPIHGIGREFSRMEWQVIGRDLVRLGYLRQASGKFSVVELTAQGGMFLKERQSITLTRPVVVAEGAKGVAGAIPCDEVLFERLRILRKKLADEQDVPAFVIFSDVALRQMARDYPANDREFARVSGVGEKKLREHGPRFMKEIAEHLEQNPRQTFGAYSSDPARKPRVGDSGEMTLRKFRAGQSVANIAQDRGLAVSTIFGHLGDAAESGEDLDLGSLLSPEDEKEIDAAFAEIGLQNITGVRDQLAGRHSYGLLKLYRAVRHRNGAVEADHQEATLARASSRRKATARAAGHA